MSSSRKLESARANGAKSRGPISPEGKLRSSLNSYVYGLAANTICYGSEDKDQHELDLQFMLDWVQPRNPYERSLCEQVIRNRPLENRALAVEPAGMDIRMIRMRVAVDAEFPSIDPQGRTALAFAQEADASNFLPLCLRYQRTANRRADRAWE